MASPYDTLQNCARHDVALRVDGEHILFEGPRNNITSEMLNAIAEHKQGLIELLGKCETNEVDSKKVASSQLKCNAIACRSKNSLEPSVQHDAEIVTAYEMDAIWDSSIQYPAWLETPRRRVVNGHASKVSARPPKEIIAYPPIHCECGRTVLRELRRLTDGKCWKCHESRFVSS